MLFLALSVFYTSSSYSCYAIGSGNIMTGLLSSSSNSNSSPDPYIDTTEHSNIDNSEASGSDTGVNEHSESQIEQSQGVNALTQSDIDKIESYIREYGVVKVIDYLLMHIYVELDKKKSYLDKTKSHSDGIKYILEKYGTADDAIEELKLAHVIRYAIINRYPDIAVYIMAKYGNDTASRKRLDVAGALKLAESWHNDVVLKYIDDIETSEDNDIIREFLDNCLGCEWFIINNEELIKLVKFKNTSEELKESAIIHSHTSEDIDLFNGAIQDLIVYKCLHMAYCEQFAKLMKLRNVSKKLKTFITTQYKGDKKVFEAICEGIEICENTGLFISPLQYNIANNYRYITSDEQIAKIIRLKQVSKELKKLAVVHRHADKETFEAIYECLETGEDVDAFNDIMQEFIGWNSPSNEQIIKIIKLKQANRELKIQAVKWAMCFNPDNEILFKFVCGCIETGKDIDLFSDIMQELIERSHWCKALSDEQIAEVVKLKNVSKKLKKYITEYLRLQRREERYGVEPKINKNIIKGAAVAASITLAGFAIKKAVFRQMLRNVGQIQHQPIFRDGGQIQHIYQLPLS